uniref:Uncharacterized protein n=1 Tax=Caenorhabditis japonica TaxID=281687 RepID=A0A8R1J128_CAEJA
MFAGISYVEHLQLVHGISDDKIIGLEGSDRSIVKIIDSNECLLHLDEFEPVPVHFGGGNGYFL